MDRIKKQSDFSRVKANDAKMGAYYTDVGHCASISQVPAVSGRRGGVLLGTVHR